MDQDLLFYNPIESSLTGINQLDVKITASQWHHFYDEVVLFGKKYDDMQVLRDQYNELMQLGNKLESSIKLNISRHDIQGLQKLNKSIGDFALDFFSAVEVISRLSNKNHIQNSSNLQHLQYDTFPEYRLGYFLGNFIKHNSRLLPLSILDNENGLTIAISINGIKNSKFHLTDKNKNLLNDLHDIKVLDLLVSSKERVYEQTKLYANQIFIKDDYLNLFYNEVYQKYIVKYGLPAVPVTTVGEKDNSTYSFKFFGE